LIESRINGNISLSLSLINLIFCKSHRVALASAFSLLDVGRKEPAGGSEFRSASFRLRRQQKAQRTTQAVKRTASRLTPITSPATWPELSPSVRTAAITSCALLSVNTCIAGVVVVVLMVVVLGGIVVVVVVVLATAVEEIKLRNKSGK
jgi:Flp pilus assembly protein TadB